MYPIIMKEAHDFVVLDAYYKGRWRLDEPTLRTYLGYLAAHDSFGFEELTVPLLLQTLPEFTSLEEGAAIAVLKQFEDERMPRACNFDPWHLARTLSYVKPGILTPPTPIIEVTPYCNYRCAWCYIPPRSLSRSEFYTLEHLRNNVVVPLLEQFGALEWCLTGGEPTLFPDKAVDTAKLISRESQRVLGRKPKRMYMLTTGYDLAANIDDFGEAGINYYQVSLSSPNSERENLLRRSPKAIDSHARALSGIDAIVDRGLNAEINMIIQPQGAHDADNLYDIPDMIKLASDRGVRMLRVIPAVPCGQAKENHVLMSPFEYAEVARMVAEGRSSAPSLIIDCPIDQRIEKDRSLYCRAGTLWLYIDFRGNVYPCNNIQEAEARCWPRTIKEDRADVIWRTSELLEYMRDYRRADLASECRECSLRVSCAGECRAMTWARYNRFDLAVKPENCYRDQYSGVGHSEAEAATTMEMLAPVGMRLS